MDKIKKIREEYARTITEKVNSQNENLLKALENVPREKFVGPGPWLIYEPLPYPPYVNYTRTPSSSAEHVYQDASIALISNQDLTNGAPGVVAGWIDAISPKKGETVFQLGGGTGYYTAILAEMVGENGHVIASEIEQDLSAKAKKNLTSWPNVTFIAEDGAKTNLEGVDCIMTNTGVTEIPSNWLQQLNPNGRMVIHLTMEHENSGLGSGASLLLTKKGQHFSVKYLHWCNVYSCLGLRTEEGDKKLTELYSTRDWNLIRSLRCDKHEEEDSCWYHTDSFCFSELEPEDI